MRRIAAVFANKRSDKSDAASTAPSSYAASTTTDATHQTTKPAPSSSKRFFRSLSRKPKPVVPAVNRLSSSDIHPPSSSSSSSGAPTTPDDDRGSLLRVPANKAWLSPSYSLDSRLGSFQHLEPVPYDRRHSALPPRPTASPSTLDTDDDSSEESSVAPDLSRPPERQLSPMTAPAFVLALTSSNLRPPFAPPPLLHVTGAPVFPRSCNAQRVLPHVDSLETTMHRKKLQHRLQRGDLSPSESRAITSFSGRRVAPKDRLSLHLDDTAVREGRVLAHSPGLRKWADRPCFEDRLLVLLAENVPAHGEPLWARVSPATAFGVPVIEFSLALELLAGLYEDDLPREPETQASNLDAYALGYLRVDTQVSLDLGPSLTQSPSSLSTSSSIPPSPVTMPSPPPPSSFKQPQSSAGSSSQSRNSIYKTSPSPLRMEAVSASPPMPSTVVTPASSARLTAVAPSAPSTSAASPSPAASAPAPLKPALKQSVRFAEEEKEDQIPLGYVMRIKQKREEKVRFLQEERERRKHEEERRRHEEEKRKWEDERATWDREKRAMEEERKKRLYAEEVAAARSRRESQRFGFGVTTGDGLATGQWDRGERPRPERIVSSPLYTRPAYDPAAHSGMPRQNSDSSLALPKASRQGSGSGSGSASPNDSRPNSVYGSGSAVGSRPPSMHSGVPTPSSSQPDIRIRDHRMSGSGSRRGSMVSESGGSWRHSEHVPIPPLPSAWNMGMNMNMSPMPMVVMPMGMPMYGMPMDMPLLPPSPPFMQHLGHRSPGGRSGSHSPQRSQSSSPTLGRQNLPATGSSERVNRMSQPRGSSASARAPSVPRSESNPHRAHHQRTSSGEVPPQRPSNHRSRTEERRGVKGSLPTSGSTSSHSQRPQPTHSSSLPPHPPPVFSQARSSWALAPGFENVSRPNPGRRQTVIS
ncbi:hypothetical protein C8Q80DRAFT_1217669 [Daedaleopsis nitida]|nr:hypothetical protein C8Q80DRAFT_1217669 [Daedaleopsis nitida]